MKRTVIDTEDNSKTLLIDQADVTYHSRHGAITESAHIFIDNGLKNIPTQNKITVFEMGLGTGLNAALTSEFARENKQLITYHSVEKYPITPKEIEELTIAKQFNNNQTQADFIEIHEVNWGKNESINQFLSLTKHQADLLFFEMRQNYYNIIFFDAFGPKFQPDLWTVDVLQKMYSSLQSKGTLVTYCAQGQFKRNLKTAGFEVENLPGPPGKREITRAIKP